MDRNYKKNLCLKEIQSAPCVQTYISCLEKISSKKVINAVIQSILDNKTLIPHFYSFLLGRVKNNILFYDKCRKSNFHLLLQHVAIKEEDYFFALEFYKVIPIKTIENFACFLNLYIYQTIKNDYKIDKIYPNFDSSLEKQVFIEYFHNLIKFYQRNKFDETTFIFLKELINASSYKDKNAFIYIIESFLNENVSSYEAIRPTLLDNETNNDFLNFYNPLHVKDVDSEKYIYLFLCYKNSDNNVCNICGMKIKHLASFFQIKEGYYNNLLDILLNRIVNLQDSNLNHILIHEPRFLTISNFKNILQFSLFRNEDIYFKLLVNFPSNNENEAVILEELKKIYNNTSSFTSIFKVFRHVNCSDKILFAVFIILYKLFVSSNSFIKRKIKNFFFNNLLTFNKLRQKIIEYVYLNGNSTYNTNEKIFAEVSDMFNYPVNDFIRMNMIYIFPISLHSVNYSKEELVKNSLYFFINSYINNGGENLSGVDNNEIFADNGYEIFAYFLVLNYNLIHLLDAFTEEGSKIYLINNIEPILFNIRTIYMEFMIECDLLNVFQFLIKTLDEYLKNFYHIEIYILLEFYLECFIFSNPFIGSNYCNYIQKNEELFCQMFYNSKNLKEILLPYLPNNILININGIIDKLLSRNINSTSGKKYLFEKVIRLKEDINSSNNNINLSEENTKLINEIFNKKIYSEEIFEFLSKIEKFNSVCVPLNIETSSYFNDDITSLSNISSFLINVLLSNINYDKQYIYYYAIQESIKIIDNLEEKPFFKSIKTFMKTKYYIKINLEQCLSIYESNIKYDKFIHNLLLYLMNDLCYKEIDLYELTKYSLLLDDNVKEMYLFIIIKYIIFKNNTSIINQLKQLLNQVLNDKENYIDKKITYFLMNLFIFLDKNIFDLKDVLDLALIVNDNYFIIYLTEKIVTLTENKLYYYNILMHSSYLINNHDYIKGLQSLIDSFSLTHLFYKLCLEKNFTLAKKCITMREENNRILEVLEVNEKTDLENETIEKLIDDESLVSWDNSYSEGLKKNIFFSETISNNLKLEKFKFFNDISLFLENKEINLVSINYKFYETFCEILSKRNFKNIERLNKLMLEVKIIKINKLIENNEIENALGEITYLLSKGEYGILYEQSKLLLKINKKIEAKLCLQKLFSLINENKINDKKLRIKITILYCKLMENGLEYDNAIKSINDSEELYFLQGKYYENKDINKSITSFILSTKYGNKYTGEAIPLIFHLYFDNDTKKEATVEKYMSDFIYKTDIYVLLPYFTQIIPKIACNNYELVKQLLIRFYNEIPEKTFWDSFIFINSSSPETKKRMDEILRAIKFDSKVLFASFTNVSLIFTKIAQSRIQRQRINLNEIIKKELEYESVTLPNFKMDCKIEMMHEEIVVFVSLQSPKRIEITGSDGKRYFFLCKSNDDLRKDGRFLEICDLLNKSFEQIQENKRENVKIKLYKVIAFNHKTGIIEWIDGLTSLKDLVYKYGEKSKIYEVVNKFRSKKKIGIKEFRNIKLTPVLHKWLEDKCNPKEWFYSRERFIQSYAVMNIIGWFMGLGDRHCENILFDRSKFTVHVDLNCLFDKAKTFEIPEKVPFRLTNNILDAFGILKVEGCYRETMEYTLKILIEKKNLIIANLLSFLYDPVFEWKKKNPISVIDELKDKLMINDIQSKVDELIKEATDENNLSEMYIGWMSFV